MNISPRILLILCMMLLHNLAFSQGINISGRVIDDQTGEPLPFANIFLVNTTVGTTTNLDGYYNLTTNKSSDSIVASALGYERMAKALSGNPNQTMHFRLSRAQFSLTEIIVTSGDDPALLLLRDVVRNKSSNNKNSLDFYQIEVYNKMQLDLTEIQNLQNKKLFKPIEFIFNNIDSTSEEVPFLPVFISESLSNYTYTNNPKSEKEEILASRISGGENESIAQFLGGMYQRIDIYENWLSILGKGFVSPIADAGKNYYRYRIIDSAFIDREWHWQVSFQPLRKGDFVFSGDMWICDSSFAVRSVSMEVADGVDINFTDRVTIFQQFEPVSDVWLLNKEKLIVSFKNPNGGAGLIGRRTTTYRKFKSEPPVIEQVKKLKGDIILDPKVFAHDNSFWNTARHEPLTKSEQEIYNMVDTLRNLPLFKTYIDIVVTLFTGYKKLGPVELGPYFKLYSGNEVEGHRFSLGMRTSNSFSRNIMLGGYVAYGTRDNRFKYGGNLIYLLKKHPRQSFTIDYKNDVNVSSDNKEEFGQDNLFSGFYRSDQPQKLVHIHEIKSFYEREWLIGYSNKIGINHRNISPYFDFAYIDPNSEKPTDSVTTSVTTTEVILKSRMAYREKFVSGEFERMSLGSTYPILQLQLTFGVPYSLNSGYSYQKLLFSVSDDITTYPLGWFHVEFTAGKTFGNLPMLLLDVHNGNVTYFYNPYSFNLMGKYEFISDRYLNLFFTHHLEGIIFNKIPGVRKLKIREVLTAKAVWGGMSEANRYHNQLNEFAVPYPIPYVEAGVGIENIFKFFTVDAIWRLTYRELENASPFGIRVGAQLTF